MTLGSIQRRRLGGLDTYELARGDLAHDTAPGPSGRETFLGTAFHARGEGDLTVVLLHGYGADGADLLPLAAETPCGRTLRWMFPEAPYPLGAAGGAGRQWFPIDERALLATQRSGVALDLAREDPPGLVEAAESVAGLVRDAGLDWRRVVVGGFSQGAMVAVEAGLRSSAPPAGIVILSGNLMAAGRWSAAAARRSGLPFFQSHGRADPVLGFQGALRLESLLREAGWRGSLAAFDGGHGVGPEAIASLAVFLDTLVP